MGSWGRYHSTLKYDSTQSSMAYFTPTARLFFSRFSYALEDSDCSDASNSFDTINADFDRMKSQFGATMVRIYAPECRDESIWINLLRAGIANNMCVIFIYLSMFFPFCQKRRGGDTCTKKLNSPSS